jgi:hypothetical protein
MRAQAMEAEILIPVVQGAKQLVLVGGARSFLRFLAFALVCLLCARVDRQPCQPPSVMHDPQSICRRLCLSIA